MSRPPKTFLTVPEVAAMLEMRGGAFLRVRRHLEDHHDFPLPMPWASRPLKWRRDQVAAWIAAQGTPQDPEPGPRDGARIHLLAEARRA